MGYLYLKGYNNSGENNMSVTVNKDKFNLVQTINEEKFYFDRIVKLVMIIGIYLHTTALFIGMETFKEKIFTIEFDRIVLVLFVYAFMGLVIYYRDIKFHSKFEWFGYVLLTFWIGISIIIHIVGQINGSINFIDASPWWYSYFFISLFLTLYFNFSRIKFN